MTEPVPLHSPERQPEDPDAALRPKSLSEFVGQKAARENLRVFIEAARGRGEAMDHVLFFGPPGLGKTTLAQIVSKELGVGFRATSGPVIAKAGDLAALLTNLEPNDVLFIDEIHRLNPVVEEVLYPAMEDRALDIIIGEGPSARSVRIDLPPFTLVGATTRQGLLTTPLRDRFGIPVRLNFYTEDELLKVVSRGAGLLGMAIDEGGAKAVSAYLKTIGLDNLPIYLDPTGRLLAALKVGNALPLSVLIDHQSRVMGYMKGAADWSSAQARALIDYYIRRISP